MIEPFFISFAGHSGSGKTTLIEKLIKLAKNKGYIVGAVKHAVSPNFEIDYPGKDSYRMKHAGAKRISVIGEGRFAMIEDEKRAFFDVKKFYSDCDFVFVEGFKNEDLYKIVVYRGLKKDFSLKDLPSVFLVVSDEPHVNIGVVTRHIDDVEGIFSYIEHYRHVLELRKKHEHSSG
ncbi:MAG: molybdopterin-guanine dinucleotide biosynthesis protein B [Deltaproteobacteria bacterium]|nr:molybdopterin-guanine dinucleotide biosynthesis protein B [Candidatus Tharpellaceae bacterium]